MSTGNNLKWGAALSYINEGIAVIMAFLYTPLKIILLGQSEYGVYQLVASIISYLSLLSMGFGSSYMRFYARYKAKGEEKKIAKLNGMFLTIFGVMSIIALLIGGIMILNIRSVLGGKFTESEVLLARTLMSFLIFNIAMTFPISVFNNYLIANEEFVFIKIIAILQNILNPLLTFPLLMIGFRSKCLVIIATILTFAQLIIYIYVCVVKLGMKFVFREFEWSLLKEIWTFSFYIFLGMIVDQINWNVDKWILGRCIGAVSVAVYSLGAQINSLFLTFSTSISSVFIPKVNTIVATSDDNKELSELFIKIGRLQFFAVTYILLGFIFLGKYFIWLMGGAGYENAYYIAFILMLADVIPLIQNIGIEIQKAKNMHRFRALAYLIIAIGNVFLTFALVTHYDAIGAAIATGIAIVLGNGFIMNWYYWKMVGLDIIDFWKNILRLVLPLGIIFLCIVLVGQVYIVDSILKFIISGMIYSILYFGMMWLLGFNAYEKGLIIQIMEKIGNRWRHA